jgi:hypothetical protein
MDAVSENILNLLLDNPQGLGYNELKKMTKLNNSVYDGRINYLETEGKIIKTRMGNLKNSPVNIKLKLVGDMIDRHGTQLKANFNHFHINYDRLNNKQKKIFLAEFTKTLSDEFGSALQYSMVSNNMFYFELYSIRMKKELTKLFEKYQELKTKNNKSYVFLQSYAKTFVDSLTSYSYDDIKRIKTERLTQSDAFLNATRMFPTLFLIDRSIMTKINPVNEKLHRSQTVKVTNEMSNGDKKYAKLLEEFFIKEVELWILRERLDEYRFEKSAKKKIKSTSKK